MKLKKILLITGAIFGVLAIGSISTVAAAGNQNKGEAEKSYGMSNRGENTSNVNFIDEDNDGVCDNVGTGMGAGSQNFIDEDNDGVCDNVGTGLGNGNGQGQKLMDGSGQGQGKGQGLKDGSCLNQ